MNSRSAKVALLSILFGPMLMRADVVFSNITSPFNGAPSNSHGVCGNGVDGCFNNALAEEFIPSANYILTGAQMLVLVHKESSGITDGANFDVSLDSDNSGAPGSLIEQIGSGLTATATSFPGSLVTANSIATPITLTAGTPYWLVLTPEANTFITWAGGGSSAPPSATSIDGGSTWPFVGTADLEFEIDGTPVVTSPVPEPASFGLLAGIVTLLYGVKRRYARA
jgi:hypothetical protein